MLCVHMYPERRESRLSCSAPSPPSPQCSLCSDTLRAAEFEFTAGRRAADGFKCSRALYFLKIVYFGEDWMLGNY